MNKSFKSFLGMALIALTVSSATPAKSEAGIILVATSHSHAMFNAGGWTAIAGIFGTIHGLEYNERLVTKISLLVFVLDANSNVTQDEAIRSFSNRFPEIDNIEIAQNYVAKLKEKFTAAQAASPGASQWYVSFSETETRAILAPAIGSSLSDDQVTNVVKSLQ